MLTARIVITGELNPPKVANRLLSKFQSAWDREAHYIKKWKGHRKFWLVGEGYVRGTYQRKKANGEYDNKVQN